MLGAMRALRAGERGAYCESRDGEIASQTSKKIQQDSKAKLDKWIGGEEGQTSLMERLIKEMEGMRKQMENMHENMKQNLEEQMEKIGKEIAEERKDREEEKRKRRVEKGKGKYRK